MLGSAPVRCTQKCSAAFCCFCLLCTIRVCNVVRAVNVPHVEKQPVESRLSRHIQTQLAGIDLRADHQVIDAVAAEVWELIQAPLHVCMLSKTSHREVFTKYGGLKDWHRTVILLGKDGCQKTESCHAGAHCRLRGTAAAAR